MTTDYYPYKNGLHEVRNIIYAYLLEPLIASPMKEYERQEEVLKRISQILEDGENKDANEVIYKLDFKMLISCINYIFKRYEVALENPIVRTLNCKLIDLLPFNLSLEQKELVIQNLITLPLQNEPFRSFALNGKIIVNSDQLREELMKC